MSTSKTPNPNSEQLKIIAVHILDDCEKHIRKNLQSNTPYKLYNEYSLTKCDKIGEYVISHEIDESTHMNKSFFTDHLKINQAISICAIVGKNGSGKSALIDIILRLLSNYSHKIVGNETNYTGAQLELVKGIRAELYFAIGSKYYLLKQSGDEKTDIKLYAWIGDKWTKQNDTKKMLNDFFYTILLNYSLYAFNTRDYGKEWNKGLHWLNGMFHKNDGYKAPVVLNPMRTEGNIDINIENELAKDRLISLFLLEEGKPNESFTKINDKNEVESIVITFDPEKVNKKYEGIKKEWLDAKYKEDDIAFRKEESISFDKVASRIIELWQKLHKFQPRSIEDEEYATATRYLAYKTIAAVQKYDAYDNYMCLQSENIRPWNDERYAELGRLIPEINKDPSHITNKIRQTIAFLLFRHTESGKMSIEKFSMSVKGLLSDKWRPIHLIPASCFTTEIILNDRNTRAAYPFAMLSSGEKQLVYTASTILYHLRNLNSIKRNSRRVKYKHFNLILDEIELYFHPEFQRRFVDYLLTCIAQMKFNEIESINIIMATHSPFILSDIPHQNASFLKDGQSVGMTKSETFGANIHTLYKDNFFIDGMPIGEFAKVKIKRLFKKIENLSTHDEAIYNEIITIGEPLLRFQLLKLYENKCPNGLADMVLKLESKLQALKKSSHD